MDFFFGIDQKIVLFIILFGVTIFMLFGTMGFTNSVSRTGHLGYILASTLLGFFLYLLLSTLLVDLIGIVVSIEIFSKGLLAVSLALLISIYGIWNASHTRITEKTIAIPGLTKSIKAMHITDTHLGHYRGGKTLQRLVNRINGANVDLVFFTGDLLDGKIQLKQESMRPLKDLKAPIYFVEGNHDKYTGVDAIKNYLSAIGVNVLTNKVVEWNELQIIGLNHMPADSTTYDMHSGGGNMSVKSALETLTYDRNRPLILVHHGPAGIKHANNAGVDLYLAGHTHGGQLFPATMVAKAIFEYNTGLHYYNNTAVHVSEGTGTFGPPMRVGTNSEMTILNLTP